MNKQVLVFALLISAAISFFLWKQIQKPKEGGPALAGPDAGIARPVPPAPILEMKKVLVAKKIIPARTRFDEKAIAEYIGQDERLASGVPADAFIADRGGIASLTNRYAAFALLASDVLTERHLLKSGQMVPALSYAIEQGKRAITIGVDPTTQAVGGFIQQGDHVDVIAVFNRSAERPDAMAKTVLQDIKVLAVGGVYQFDQSLASTPPALGAGKIERITLQVTPEEMERLTYLSSMVQFRVALKHPDDVGTSKVITSPGANEKSLMMPLSDAAMAMPSAPAPAGTAEAASVATPVAMPMVFPTAAPVVAATPIQPKVEIFYGLRRQEMRMDVGTGMPRPQSSRDEEREGSVQPNNTSLGGTAAPTEGE